MLRPPRKFVQHILQRNVGDLQYDHQMIDEIGAFGDEIRAVVADGGDHRLDRLFPEFLGRRYNVAVQLIHATIWGIFYLVMLGVMLWLTALMLETILGWDPLFSVWLIIIVTGVYTFSGGLTAVVMTDVVQMVVFFIGGAALTWLSLWEVGGWEGLKEKVFALGPQYLEAVFHEYRLRARARPRK